MACCGMVGSTISEANFYLVDDVLYVYRRKVLLLDFEVVCREAKAFGLQINWGMMKIQTTTHTAILASSCHWWYDRSMHSRIKVATKWIQ